MRSNPSSLIHLQKAEENKHPLILIVGPTAVGKTEISIQLAEHLNGEIVSADSRLFYRGMDIGTAKPTPEERQAVADARHPLVHEVGQGDVGHPARGEEPREPGVAAAGAVSRPSNAVIAPVCAS